MKLSKEIEELLDSVAIALVATADPDSQPNISIKGIVDYDVQEGIIYFLDLFSKNTRKNLKINPRVSLSVIDYDMFAGYQFIGTAEMLESGDLYDKYAASWEKEESNRFKDVLDWGFKRILSNHPATPHLPKPKYLVKVTINKIINLAPFNIV
ncbi:MAG: pyridoxamine 5'-phosphate oxidase family protein [bacterium]|nr:pyridoxamine 5'-phosphate oxidase family protein [bacterium]